VVLAESFARIHWRNLANMGVLPLTVEDADAFERGDRLELSGLRGALSSGDTEIDVRVSGERTITARCELSPRQREMVLAGGLVSWQRQQVGG